MRNVQITAEISVTLKKSRRRTLGLVVKPGGAVELRLPFHVSFKRGEVFVKSQSAWIQKKREELRENPLPFLERGNAEEYQCSKEAARRLITERLTYFEEWYGWQATKVRVGRQKSRWGSCSKKGTLSFSYRLIFLPEHLRDYIIVHELCHLTEFNHSPRFWALVARFYPNYRELRRALRSL